MSSIQACGSSICVSVLWLAAGLILCSAGPGSKSDPNTSDPEQITVTGTVVREDGTPPPFGVTIERDCGSGYRQEGHAETSGYFFFRIGRAPASNGATPATEDQAIWKIAVERTEASPRSELGLCMLRARLQGYRSSIVQLSGNPGATLDVGRIVLYSETKTAPASVSLTGLKAPKKARKAMERGLLALRKSNFQQAEVDLNKSLSIYPGYPEALYHLGCVKEGLQLYGEAEQVFCKAVELDSNYVPPYIGLARCAWRRLDWQQMLERSGRCILLQPRRFPEAFFLNAIALYKLNRLETAEEIARKGLQVDVERRYPKLHLLLAEILYSRHSVSGSIQEMRQYLQTAGNAPDFNQVRAILQSREEGGQ